jgi:hypothetical protein
VTVTVPSVEQEAARDLVRAREDVRGDLMRLGGCRSCCCVRGSCSAAGRLGPVPTRYGCAASTPQGYAQAAQAVNDWDRPPERAAAAIAEARRGRLDAATAERPRALPHAGAAMAARWELASAAARTRGQRR